METRLQNQLLKFSRSVLENAIDDKGHDLNIYRVPEFEEKRGMFVTLHKKGNLRGCIGRLEANNSIYHNVIDLSKAAAFEDHRFSRLTSKELKLVNIEISLLSLPEPIEGTSSYDKILKIKPKIDGIILTVGGRNATFLPQVWNSVPIREDFISELCRKAGLGKDYWEKNDIELSKYRVECFEEE